MRLWGSRSQARAPFLFFQNTKFMVAPPYFFNQDSQAVASFSSPVGVALRYCAHLAVTLLRVRCPHLGEHDASTCGWNCDPQLGLASKHPLLLFRAASKKYV